jgi:hypothetical protein
MDALPSSHASNRDKVTDVIREQAPHSLPILGDPVKHTSICFLLLDVHVWYAKTVRRTFG